VRREGREGGRVGIVVSRLEAPRALIYAGRPGGLVLQVRREGREGGREVEGGKGGGRVGITSTC